MKKLSQKQKLLQRLEKNKGKRISFRAFRWDWIAEPGSRKSELCSEGCDIVNNWFYNKDWQRCSYYSINPKRSSAKDAYLKWETIELFIS